MTRRRRLSSFTAVLFLLAVACTPSAPAASSASPVVATSKPLDPSYFKDKTIKVLVAGNPGGGVDANARLMGTYLAKYLPGNPTFTYTAMTGGAGIAIGNTLSDRAATRNDGLTLAAPGPALPVFQVSQTPGVAYDATKLEWVGGLTEPDAIFFVKTSTGVTTMEQLKTNNPPVIFGAGPKTNQGYVVPEMLRTDSGFNIKVVGGLGTTPETFLALERGDIQASYETYTNVLTRKELIDNKTIKIIARQGTNEKELDGLPQIYDYLSSDAKLIAGMLVPGWGRPLALPPGTPAEVVKAYRDAMVQMTADPQFQADAKKLGLTGKLVTGPECLAIAQRIIGAPANIVQRYKTITQG